MLIEHWKDSEQREYPFFFCQIEAIETLIWLIETADAEKTGISIPDPGRWPRAKAAGPASPEISDPK